MEKKKPTTTTKIPKKAKTRQSEWNQNPTAQYTTAHPTVPKHSQKIWLYRHWSFIMLSDSDLKVRCVFRFVFHVATVRSQYYIYFFSVFFIYTHRVHVHACLALGTLALALALSPLVQSNNQNRTALHSTYRLAILYIHIYHFSPFQFQTNTILRFDTGEWQNCMTVKGLQFPLLHCTNTSTAQPMCVWNQPSRQAIFKQAHLNGKNPFRFNIVV